MLKRQRDQRDREKEGWNEGDGEGRTEGRRGKNWGRVKRRRGVWTRRERAREREREVE